MNAEEKWELATRNTVEIMTEKEFKELINEGKNFDFYFGVAPTGPFHLGYSIVTMKTIDLIKVGGKAKILIADFHAYLDDMKTPWEEMDIRSKYFEDIFKIILRDYDVKIVRGSEFQATREYIEDTLRLSGMVNIKRAIKAASEVVRMRENPLVSSLIYPIMQNVDVKHLKARVALGGIDQRHIYAMGREILPKIGWNFIAVYTPLITSLKGPGSKMSASKPETHISVHNSDEVIERKIKNAYCPPNETKDNPIIDICRYIIFPYFGKMKIETLKEGTLEYNNYKSLEQDYKNGRIHPLDLKMAVKDYVIKFISPVREYFEKRKDFLEQVRESMKKSGYIF